MLRQASVAELKKGTVSRKGGHVVIAMRTYPRQVTKLERDEYIVDLSPEPALFREFKECERRTGDHDAAFAEVRYEQRFALGSTALSELARMSKLAAERDVYLICQCARGARCHRELLLLAARHAFDADAEPPLNAYPEFTARLERALPPEGRTARYPRE